MPYLNLDLDYFSHPKVRRLVGILGPEHVAIPIRLWCYVGKYHCATGMLQAYSVGELESAVEWSGDSGKLVDALVKIKFIEKKRNGYMIHDWLDHAGHLLAFKKRAKTAAKKRWADIATSNASSTPKHKITNAPNHPNHPNPLSSLSSLKKEKKEKKEKKKTTGDLKVTPAGQGVETWEFYSEAYKNRYGVDPIRNESVNSMMCSLVRLIGADASPQVAAFYLGHNDPFYVRARHPPNLLLRDASGLHTQWATGIKATPSEAKSAGQHDDAVEQVKRVEAMLKKGPL